MPNILIKTVRDHHPLGEGMSIQDAAFETFSGKWAKSKGYTKVRIRDAETEIQLDRVILNFLKK